METKDRYEGCPEEVAQALKDGLVVKGWFWYDDEKSKCFEGWLDGYCSTYSSPWIAGHNGYKNFSITDPRIRRKISSVKDALDWSKANPWEVVREHCDAEDVLWVAREFYNDACIRSNISIYKVLTCKDPETWTPLTEIEL